MEFLPDINEKFTPEVLLSMAEVQQARSNFQLEKFVVNQHETEEMRYVQCLLELQSMYYTVKTVTLEMKKSEIEIARLRSTGDDIDEIDAQLKELGLEQTRLVGIGAFRELDTLLAIYDSFEHKFTRNEVEEGQPAYWSQRLNRQAVLEAIGGTQAQAAHLDSLRQIGELKVEGNALMALAESKRDSLDIEETKELA